MPREYGNAPHYAVYLPFAFRLSVQCPGKRWENVLDMTGCTLSPPQQVKEGNKSHFYWLLQRISTPFNTVFMSTWSALYYQLSPAAPAECLWLRIAHVSPPTYSSLPPHSCFCQQCRPFVSNFIQSKNYNILHFWRPCWHYRRSGSKWKDHW